MSDQEKIMNGAGNPIMNLVDYEKSIKQIDIEHPVTVKLARDGKTLLLKHGGIEVRGVVNRPIIHQLGGRAWGNNENFVQINQTWNKMFAESPSDLEQELSSVFRENDICIRYETNSRNENAIYGIVTPRFVDIDPFEFRQQFVEQVLATTGTVPISDKVVVSKFGQIT